MRAASSRSATRSPPSGRGQEGSLLLWLLILLGLGVSAVLLNRRLTRDVLPWMVPILAGVATLLRLPPRLHRDAVRDAGGAARRARAEPEPAEPVHADPPAAPLPRLRRPDRPVRVRDGRARLAPDGRALDRRDAAVDARRPGRFSGSRSCSARSGPTRRSAGAAGTRGIPSRTPRSCRGSSPLRSSTR